MILLLFQLMLLLLLVLFPLILLPSLLLQLLLLTVLLLFLTTRRKTEIYYISSADCLLHVPQNILKSLTIRLLLFVTFRSVTSFMVILQFYPQNISLILVLVIILYYFILIVLQDLKVSFFYFTSEYYNSLSYKSTKYLT